MMTHEMHDPGILEQYTGSLRQYIEDEYRIEDTYLRGDLKRGLRNADGTGVPVGVTKVGNGDRHVAHNFVDNFCNIT